MTRTELRDFLKAGVNNINPSLHFGSGRITEFNSLLNKEFKAVWWESDTEDSAEIINHNLPQDTWPIKLHIGDLDTAGSLPAEYEAIVDACHYVAQQLVRQYNAVIADSDTVTINGITRVPFIKKHGDRITGVILSFNIVGPDKTNLC